MKLTEIYEMIAGFKFPATAAFAYIFLEDQYDAYMMEKALLNSSYSVLKCRTGNYWEVRFWPAHRTPFNVPERKQKNIENF